MVRNLFKARLSNTRSRSSRVLKSKISSQTFKSCPLNTFWCFETPNLLIIWKAIWMLFLATKAYKDNRRPIWWLHHKSIKGTNIFNPSWQLNRLNNTEWWKSMSILSRKSHWGLSREILLMDPNLQSKSPRKWQKINIWKH